MSQIGFGKLHVVVSRCRVAPKTATFGAVAVDAATQAPSPETARAVTLAWGVARARRSDGPRSTAKTATSVVDAAATTAASAAAAQHVHGPASSARVREGGAAPSRRFEPPDFLESSYRAQAAASSAAVDRTGTGLVAAFGEALERPAIVAQATRRELDRCVDVSRSRFAERRHLRLDPLVKPELRKPLRSFVPAGASAVVGRFWGTEFLAFERGHPLLARALQRLLLHPSDLLAGRHFGMFQEGLRAPDRHRLRGPLRFPAHRLHLDVRRRHPSLTLRHRPHAVPSNRVRWVTRAARVTACVIATSWTRPGTSSW